MCMSFRSTGSVCMVFDNIYMHFRLLFLILYGLNWLVSEVNVSVMHTTSKPNFVIDVERLFTYNKNC